MAALFPQVTGAFPLGERPAHRFWLSPLLVGATTGVLVRLYRAVTLTIGPNESLLYVGTAFVVGQLLLLGMATLHLGNVTVRRWVWLAPAFAFCEAIAEALTSLVLIAGGWERVGSMPARWSDWSELALNTLVWRVAVILVFALLLAGVVQLVRRLNVKRLDREHTLDAVDGKP
jgi:hypothetical protein